MAKQSEILFPHANADPEASGAEQLKTLAAALNSALDSGHGRVELEAYGGPPGDKSSDSRRLSLRRALAVRQLLIDSGVPSDRIDVKALGGIDDHGNADRVDVFLSGNS
jgi:outer membrane protein OmpA-like peptidoglycan-associated protein